MASQWSLWRNSGAAEVLEVHSDITHLKLVERDLAAREAHLAEIRSVRLITLNYCPMGCTFCSATNFLHEAQGSVASI